MNESAGDQFRFGSGGARRQTVRIVLPHKNAAKKKIDLFPEPARFTQLIRKISRMINDGNDG
ncbi:hypothetical protein, partial [Rhizobium ruizarguesonis]|uniref:hypothetical protein n=1 Tax=Rhizobium ruizarguesonis TaxID=2081791 RepID=UPI001952BC18